MKMVIRASVAALLVMDGLGDSLQAGAWTREAGQGFFKLGSRYVHATRYYGPAGDRLEIPTLQNFTQSFYGEYGLSGKLTVIAYLPFLQRITLNRVVFENSGVESFPGDSKTGFADADFGIRYLLFRKGATVFSGEVNLGLPVGDHRQANALYTGDGEFNQRLGLAIGHSFYPRAFYLSGFLGFNNRTGGFSDEWHYGAEAGYTFAGRATLILRATGVESLENGRSDSGDGNVGLFANNQRYLAFGPELSVRISDSFGVSLGVEGATRARSVLSAPAFQVGFYLAR